MRVTIFGTGRVGSSMAHYARALGAEVDVITRADAASQISRTRTLVESADVVAAAIPDDRLGGWIEEWRAALGPKPAIHFSGALIIDGMASYHPLFSFPVAPLPPDQMAKIAIAREEGAPPFASLFPGAPNPEFVVSAQDRAYYHALAVVSGNFAAHLWNETARAFEARFNLPAEKVFASYLAGVVERFRESPLDSMTGPVARRDGASIKANLAALAGDPRLKALYLAFLNSAWPGYGEPPEDAG
ncbi:MAG: DUF2520 domain-containing protein [Parvularculaceae bacterium]|nr:DUF2520 domain-containing protein [Parvularculaceae bacterium]